jgi:hypothetical protein
MMANPSVGARIVNYIFWEPVHFFMERKMLLTIKDLAEKHPLAGKPGALSPDT